MIEWTTAASMTARTGIAAYQNRHLLQGWIKKTLAHFDFGSTEILVTGRPSVGKTVLVNQVQGDGRNWEYKLPNISTSTETDAVKFGNWTKLIRTLPGQDNKTRITGINRSFDDNLNLLGVIHTVDFGYTIPRDATICESLIKESKIDTIQKLRDYNLLIEIEELKKIITTIEINHVKQGTPKWLIIAVNKVDLFSDKLDEALSFYHPSGKSAFSMELNKLTNKLGEYNFSIYVIATCAYKASFEWNGESCTSKFFQQEQEKLMSDFINTVGIISEIQYEE